MADAGLLGPGTAVVALGLASAALFGAGDFGGGLATRRSALFGVVLGSQVVGMALALVLAIVRGEPAPGPVDIGWAAVGGVVGAVGISSLYQGLAVGRMGVVAPVTGVLAAAVPVVAGIVIEGMPSTPVIAGIALAIVAVILVSRVAGDAGARSGLEFGLLAGLGIGLFSLTVAQITEGLAFGPLTILRGVEAIVIAGLVLVSRGAWRVPRSVWPLVVLVGSLDMAGNGAYILATQAGSLAVASVLSALYPVTTVILAAWLLRERMTRDHAVGVITAFVAIGLIASGGGG
jgi:drug/metabolite transporter (DMT)-like permease